MTSPIGDARVRKLELWLLMITAVGGALLPEITDRFYRGDLIMVTYTVGPLVFLTSVVCAYYVSGRSKWVSLLLLLVPIAFYAPAQLLLIILGFAFATHP